MPDMRKISNLFTKLKQVQLKGVVGGDWYTESFIRDGGFYDLDLSSVVGVRKCVVVAHVGIEGSILDRVFKIRSVEEDMMEAVVTVTKTGALNSDYSVIFRTDSQGRMNYNCNSTISAIELNIKLVIGIL
jgi:hypothetical protein